MKMCQEHTGRIKMRKQEVKAQKKMMVMMMKQK